jgi:hypothetical protein
MSFDKFSHKLPKLFIENSKYWISSFKKFPQYKIQLDSLSRNSITIQFSCYSLIQTNIINNIPLKFYRCFTHYKSNFSSVLYISKLIFIIIIAVQRSVHRVLLFISCFHFPLLLLLILWKCLKFLWIF